MPDGSGRGERRGAPSPSVWASNVRVDPASGEALANHGPV